jgi:hypothetical protein
VTPQEALAAVREAFESVPRPELMIRGTCSCCECAEHNLTLLSRTPETITLQELGSPAWDPMCFASDAAFAYYLPAMIRLALEDTIYVDQLSFHLSWEDRVDSMNRQQARAVLDALWVITDRELGDGSEQAYRFDQRLMEEAIRKVEERIAKNF